MPTNEGVRLAQHDLAMIKPSEIKPDRQVVDLCCGDSELDHAGSFTHSPGHF